MNGDVWEITELELAVLRALANPRMRHDMALYEHVAALEGTSRQRVRLAHESLHRHGAVIRWDGQSARTARGREAA